MTQLVVDAEHKGALPPTRFSPRQLQHPAQPTISELRAALGLHRLSRAVAVYFSELHDEDCWAEPKELQATLLAEWMSRVSQTVLRVLILGAALAGAYKEPLFKAREHADPDIRNIPSHVPRNYVEDATYSLEYKQLDFLLKFAVCDLAATVEAQDAVFGPVADWLLESIMSDRDARQAMAKRFDQGYGRASFCQSREADSPCPVDLADGSGSHSDAHHVLWEVMKMLWMAQHFCLGAQDHPVLVRPSSDPDQAGSVDEHHRASPKLAIAVFFGMFQAEQVMLPTPARAGAFGQSEPLITLPVVHQAQEGACRDWELARGLSAAVLFDWIFDNSKKPNESDYVGPVPSLELKFFEYFLRRHLGLCYDSRTEIHGGTYLNCAFMDFPDAVAIFSPDDIPDRGPLERSSNTLYNAHFLDGSEVVTKYPPHYDR
jgi:hypothetical protein